jgi:hypothetical protein
MTENLTIPQYAKLLGILPSKLIKMTGVASSDEGFYLPQLPEFKKQIPRLYQIPPIPESNMRFIDLFALGVEYAFKQSGKNVPGFPMIGLYKNPQQSNEEVATCKYSFDHNVLGISMDSLTGDIGKNMGMKRRAIASPGKGETLALTTEEAAFLGGVEEGRHCVYAYQQHCRGRDAGKDYQKERDAGTRPYETKLEKDAAVYVNRAIADLGLKPKKVKSR